MRKRANSQNATRIEFTQKPNSVFVHPETEPEAAKLAKRRAGITPKPPKVEYPTEANVPVHSEPEPKHDYKELRHKVHGLVKIHRIAGTPFNVKEAARKLKTTTELIEELLDEVTR